MWLHAPLIPATWKSEVRGNHSSSLGNMEDATSKPRAKQNKNMTHSLPSTVPGEARVPTQGHCRIKSIVTFVLLAKKQKKAHRL